MHRISTGIFALLVCAAGTGWAGECETVAGAYSALAKVPAYRQVTQLNGKPLLDAIMIGDTFYVNNDGTWSKMPLGPGMREEMMKKVIPDASALKGCKSLGSEKLDGFDTDIFEYQPPPMEGVGASGPQRVWIGTTDGLPHRMASDQVGKAIDVRITFENVAPPIQ